VTGGNEITEIPLFIHNSGIYSCKVGQIESVLHRSLALLYRNLTSKTH